MATIGVLGAGAVGGLYGALLAHAGHRVRLVTPSYGSAIARDGLRVRVANGAGIAIGRDRLHLVLPHLTAHATPAAAGPCDWVLVALKTTAFAELPRLLPPLLAPHSRVVVACNGLDVEDPVAALVGPARTFGLLCFVCANRDADGTVRHLGHGRVQVGHAADDAGERARLAALFRHAGVTVEEPPTLRAARWRKLCWNIPFNGLSVADGGRTVDAILADPRLRARAERLMHETIAIANADLAARGAPGAITDAGAWVADLFARTATMGAYQPSTLIDLRHGRALELDAIITAPLRRASALGVAVPELTMLAAGLRDSAGFSGKT
jgi:2-dehydropantoate 2-reductase